jgi:hypothetical protein
VLWIVSGFYASSMEPPIRVQVGTYESSLLKIYACCFLVLVPVLVRFNREVTLTRFSIYMKWQKTIVKY